MRVVTNGMGRIGRRALRGRSAPPNARRMTRALAPGSKWWMVDLACHVRAEGL
jgi:hypothetical protein